MPSFDYSVTDPPRISTSSPVNTLRNWAGYVIVIAMMFVAFAVAQNSVQPLLASVFGMIPGVNPSQDGGGVSVDIAGDL